MAGVSELSTWRAATSVISHGAVLMGLGLLTGDQSEKLAHYLRQRQARDRIVALLKELKDEHDLKQGTVTVSKNATYDQLVDSLDVALKEDWLSRPKLVEIIEQLEAAGRQHVMLFITKSSKASELAQLLTSPRRQRNSIAELEEFWEVPSNSFSRVFSNDGAASVVKVVARRNYHTIDTLEQTVDYEVFKRLRHEERSAIVIKNQRREGVLQIRVPPREHGSAETPKRVFEYASEVLAEHYNWDALMSCVKEFPISDAIPKIIENRKDFTLEHDTPEDNKIKGSLSCQRGTDGKPADLRDCEGWKFGKGYSRRTIRGTWKKGTADLYAHINHDIIQLDGNTVQKVARLFIPGRCTDEDVDHVVARIQEHT